MTPVRARIAQKNATTNDSRRNFRDWDACVFVFLGVTNLAVLFGMWRRASGNRPDEAVAAFAQGVESIGPGHDRIQRTVRGEFANARNESTQRGQLLREEISSGNRSFNETILKQMIELAREQRGQAAKRWKPRGTQSNHKG
jgi:hypothetical protein